MKAGKAARPAKARQTRAELEEDDDEEEDDSSSEEE
jgi:hypothetical protein